MHTNAAQEVYSRIDFVAVPPHQLLVYDASGRDVAGAVGPLQEGDNLVLTCEVRGGKLINRDIFSGLGVARVVYCALALYSRYGDVVTAALEY